MPREQANPTEPPNVLVHASVLTKKVLLSVHQIRTVQGPFMTHCFPVTRDFSCMAVKENICTCLMFIPQPQFATYVSVATLSSVAVMLLFSCFSAFLPFQ